MERANNSRLTTRLPVITRLATSILRLFFKLIYHQLAWAYDLVAWTVSLGNWQTWVKSVVPYLEGLKILEIGFGPGHLLASLRQKNMFAIGLDESRQMVRIAQARLRRNGFQPSLIRGAAQTLPIASESFQQVVMTFPSEFILNSATLLEVRRVLAPGGSALVLPLAWVTGRKPLERLAAWVSRITGEAPDWDPQFLRVFNGAGFEVSWEMAEFRSSKIVLVRLLKVGA